MTKYIIAFLAVFWLMANSASAQMISVGPCVLLSGAGSPESAVVGAVCDQYLDTATGKWYQKRSGTGNTGWVLTVYPDQSNTFGLFTQIFASNILGPNYVSLGGVVGCGNPPTTANCEAASLTFESAFFEQRLKTDPSYRTQWYVDIGGGTGAFLPAAHLTAYDASGWIPLKLTAGPVEVGGGGLHVGSAVVTDPGLGNSYLDGFIGSYNYASQTTGWRCTYEGACDVRYLFTDEMHAKKFIADVEIALLGGVAVTKSQAKLAAPFLVPAKGSIGVLTVKDISDSPNAAVYESGDTVLLRTFSRTGGGLDITNAWGVVSNYTDLGDGMQSWNWQRYTGNNGGSMAEASVTLPVDALALDFGVTGSGYYEISAADGLHAVNSPYSQVVTWIGISPIAANLTVRMREGNLKGIGPGTWGYGLFAGDYANGRYAVFSDQTVELHGVPLSLWNGTTRVLYGDPVTPYWAMGLPAPTSYSTGNGCWSGVEGGYFKWRCGDIASGTNYIAWDGGSGTLTVKGNITITGEGIDADSLVGTPGATVVSGAARGALGIDANGLPSLPHVATPSGSGLFLGSDYMGYYASGAWKTFMDNAGNFYLGGTSGALQWHDSTLTISATLAGNGAGITSINGGNITTGSITATQIAANTITADKIAAGTITATEIAANTITAAKIAAGTITATEIAGGTITGAKIAAGTISATQIAALSLTAAVIDSNAITTNKLNAQAVTAQKIATGTITATQIASGTITADKLNVSSLSAITADLGSVTAGQIVVGGSNKLWLNDSADGSLALGGTSKTTAPFRVNSLGQLYATNPTFSGTLYMDGHIQANDGLYIEGSIQFLNLGGGEARYVCVDNSGWLFASQSPCY